MKNEDKTKEQLISELIELRRRIVELEESLKFTNKQFRDFRKTAKETDKELERVSMELAIRPVPRKTERTWAFRSFNTVMAPQLRLLSSERARPELRPSQSSSFK